MRGRGNLCARPVVVIRAGVRLGGIVTRTSFYRIAALVVALFAAPQMAGAQTDEIQVYDGGLAEPGVFNLTVHTNFTPVGLKAPAFPGGNSRHWDSTRFTSEIRPIIGWHLKPVDIIVNPIVDTAYDGIKNLEFVPATRVAYNFSPEWAVAVEEYADFGPLRGFRVFKEQSHQLYAVVDHSSKIVDIQIGVGFGLTDASDKYTVKMILSRDLNGRSSGGSR
jgi:hypothetical protein